MQRILANALILLGAPLIGVLAVWWPVPALIAAGCGVSVGMKLLRRNRDKSAAAIRAARRPLVEALWRHSAGGGGDALAAATLDLLEGEGVTDAVVLAEFDPERDGLRGHRVDPMLSRSFELDAPECDGLVGQALRLGRPVVPEPGALSLEKDLAGSSSASGGEEWIALPLLDPAPLGACVDGGFLHQLACPWREAPDSAADGGWRGACAGCAHDPVRGVLALRRLESVHIEELADLLEGLARTLGSILSLRRLGSRLQTLEAGREQLLDAMLNGLLSTDSEGRVRYMNRRARELAGGSDPVGRRLDEVVTLPAGRTSVTRALIEGRATLRAEGLLRRQPAVDEPENLPVRVNLTPLHTMDGAIRGAVCVLEDRSDVLALENEVRHLDTLAALGRFASGLAHEVRNPLGGIQAGVEYLEQSGGLDEELCAHLRVIQGEVQRVDSILFDLLQVAKPRELVAGPVDPGELARSVLDGFERLAEAAGVELLLRAPDESGEVYVDAAMIRQVLVNLVKNAIEASPRGGQVVLQVIPVDPADASRARAGFVVSDQGPGLPAEDRDRVFEPFYTSKSEGTGLGLYVSHGFVERHGGRLRIEDHTGGGTRVRVELPRVTALVGG